METDSSLQNISKVVNIAVEASPGVLDFNSHVDHRSFST